METKAKNVSLGVMLLTFLYFLIVSLSCRGDTLVTKVICSPDTCYEYKAGVWIGTVDQGENLILVFSDKTISIRRKIE